MTTPADKPPHCAEHRIEPVEWFQIVGTLRCAHSWSGGRCFNQVTAIECDAVWCEEHRPTRRGKK